jgi:hypothetical protein
MGLSKEKDSAESIFWQFEAEYLHEFKTELENILGS